VEYLQTLVYGVVLGSIIAVAAMALSATYGILRFANFAHGDLLTIGAYGGFVFFTLLGWPMYVAFPLGMAVTALVSVGLDRALYQRLRASSPVILLISSFGVALALRAGVQLIFGPDNVVYQQGIEPPYRFGAIRIKPTHFYIVGGAVAIVAGLHLFLQRTKVGKAMRAMSDNAELARVSGIDTERVIAWTWLLGGALAGAAGLFLALDTQLHPQMGWKLLLPIFAAAIFGGIGKPYGAILGGLIIGIAQEYSTFVISPAYKPAVAFAIMVLVLIVRPEGIIRGLRTT
jgi:branched-chain amino acid transport system permease protein/neutral amino acid transport system permease protein